MIAQNEDEAREAVGLYRAGRGDFADHLIGLLGRSAACRDTVTFDRHLKAVEGFSLLE